MARVTLPGNMLVKFEDRSLHHFKLVWLTGPLHTHAHTHTHTHIKQKQYLAIHFVHLIEIIAAAYDGYINVSNILQISALKSLTLSA